MIASAGAAEFSGLLVALSLPVAAALLSPSGRRHLFTIVNEDALEHQRLRAPNPWSVLVLASLCGLLIAGTWCVRSWVVPDVTSLFTRDGPLETLTCLLFGLAALLVFAAALQWRMIGAPQLRWVPLLYGLCGGGLLVIALEEFSQGETFLNLFMLEPGATGAGEGSAMLDTLIGHEALTPAWAVVSITFLLGVLGLSGWSWFRPRSWVSAISPHPGLIPLAVITAYSGLRLHPEVTELLLAVFFTFHGYRVSRAARESGNGRRWETAVTPAVHVAHVPVAAHRPRLLAARRPQRATLTVPVECLEHTHDAIVIWEMNGDGIVYWNRAAELLYGYTRDEAVGQVSHALLKTQVLGGVSMIEEHLARFGIWLGELRHTCSDGHVVVVEARLALMSQQSGRWLVLETNRDVSDRRAAEETAREMEQQLSTLHNLRIHGD